MKILYVITTLSQGGAEHVLINLANRMHKEGHKVDIIYFKGNLENFPDSNEINVHRIKITNIFNMISGLINIIFFIKKNKPDIVHSHLYHPNILTRVVKYFNRKLILINSIHSGEEGKSLVRRFAYKRTNFLPNIITNVSLTASHAVERRFSLPKNSIKTIYNGIDMNKYRYIKDSKEKICSELNLDLNCKIIISIGRLVAIKDHRTLLLAFKNFLDRVSNSEYHLLICGEGVLKEDLIKLSRNLMIYNHVHFLGNRKDIPELLSASDLFVLSSINEGLPTVLIEALACGTPCISTDCNGAAEILYNQADCIIPIGNPIAMENAIYKFLNIEVLPEYRNENRNLVYGRFSLDIYAQSWMNIYRIFD